MRNDHMLVYYYNSHIIIKIYSRRVYAAFYTHNYYYFFAHSYFGELYTVVSPDDSRFPSEINDLPATTDDVYFFSFLSLSPHIRDAYICTYIIYDIRADVLYYNVIYIIIIIVRVLCTLIAAVVDHNLRATN